MFNTNSEQSPSFLPSVFVMQSYLYSRINCSLSLGCKIMLQNADFFEVHKTFAIIITWAS